MPGVCQFRVAAKAHTTKGEKKQELALPLIATRQKTGALQEATKEFKICG
jgi:hypothetical protein